MAKYKMQHTKVEDLVIPGATLSDIINFGKMDLDELAEKTGVSRVDIENLMAGEMQFTEDISKKLVEAIKLPEEFWFNLQKNYNDEKNKIIKREKNKAAKIAENSGLSEDPKN